FGFAERHRGIGAVPGKTQFHCSAGAEARAARPIGCAPMNQNMTRQMSMEDRDRQRLENLSRRRFLKGVSACIALPAFASMLEGGTTLAAQGAGQVAATSTGAPLRTAFGYFPNGAIPANFWPTGE